MLLRGRTALITGARGIGAATAHALRRAGASVILADADHALLAADIGDHAVTIPTDLTNPVSLRRLVEQTLGAFGRLDAAVNTTHAALAMPHQIPPMRQAGHGCIINLADSPATIALTRAAALTHAPSGIRINAITGHPAHIPDTIVWLCSDAASSITGETVRFDGPGPAGGIRRFHAADRS